MNTYEEHYAMKLSHVVIEYNRYQQGGPVWAVRINKTGRCIVVVNPGTWGSSSIERTLQGAPSDLVAKQFLVAHEIAHCLFTPQMSQRNLSLAKINIESEELAQEVMADLSALVFLKLQGSLEQSIFDWISSQRSGHIFSQRYNTGIYLTARNVARVERLLTARRAELSYYAENPASVQN